MQYGIRFMFVNGMAGETLYNSENDRDETFESLKTVDWSKGVGFNNAIVNLRNVIRCDKFERQNACN